jgi:hypothetical protein
MSVKGRQPKMPVSVYYENDDQVVIWQFEGNWTWEEYYTQRNVVNQHIANSPHTVDMIIDMTRSKLLPSNLLTHAGSAARNAPANIGKTIFVGENAILKAFFAIFNQLYGVVQSGKDLNFQMVSTRDEAYTLLKTNRQTQE